MCWRGRFPRRRQLRLDPGDEEDDDSDDDSDDEEYGTESDGSSEEPDSEDNDSELGGSEPMDFGEELEELDNGNDAGAADDDDGTADDDDGAADVAVIEAADVESTGSDEFHDAVFYYFEGELEALQQQDAQAAGEKEGEWQPQMDMFYDAPTVPYRKEDEIE
ncbi:hypothetical protein NQ176_g10532 [Zarea fungicola]|uniref:Uncharacterized protein n=1 Tax=Zarea fungicola TaxID=93591 RepID=A0ACC1MFV2_9HYPO|nr:hypothetical protein NQ176_g10532 [Lecanicillium fungicola]